MSISFSTNSKYPIQDSRPNTNVDSFGSSSVQGRATSSALAALSKRKFNASTGPENEIRFRLTSSNGETSEKVSELGLHKNNNLRETIENKIYANQIIEKSARPPTAALWFKISNDGKTISAVTNKNEVSESNENLILLHKNKIFKTSSVAINSDATVIDSQNKRRHISEFEIEEISEEDFHKFLQSYLEKISTDDEESDDNLKTDRFRRNKEHGSATTKSEENDTLLEKITEKTDRYKLEKKLDRRREDNRLLDNLKHEIKKQKV